MVVKIHIQLTDTGVSTNANISYEYTALTESGNRWLIEEVDRAFEETMDYWEKAINHYLATGKMLRKLP